MTTNTTIKTQIVVEFDDQFTDAAKRANENYFKSFEEAQQKARDLKANYEPFYESTFKEIRKVFNELDALHKSLAAISVLVPIAFGIVHPTAFIISLTTAGIALAGFYGLWFLGEKLKEWMIAGQPVEEYVGGVKESLEQLANAEPPALPPIPPETVQSLEITKTCLEQIQNMQDVLIMVNLLDNATEQAKAIRAEIEAIFSQDITQRITIIEETIRSAAPPLSSSSNSFFDDGLPEFLTSSPDLTGFNKSVGFSPAKPALPSFAGGIDRVPRDMLALIHKDEAVLPKNRAEDFRRGGSGGMSIKNLNFSFNVANGAKLDREEFRNMAFIMRDELKRLDRRIN